MEYEQVVRASKSIARRPRRRRKPAAAFRFGIEEEYFLADRNTGDVATETPQELFTAAGLATEGLVGREFLQSQVEVATRPLNTAAEAVCELRYARSVLNYMAGAHGLCIQSCGTHPSGRWRNARQSHDCRYDKVMQDLQMIGERNMLCGMHVHVELPDPSRRVDVMRRMLPLLPLFLALSASSPFWQGRPTGLHAYRLAAYDELPRTGVPEVFRNAAEFDAYVSALVKSGVIEDSSYLWWMVRPSAKYPTLELRAPDACTRVEDAVAIASLYRAVVRHLFVNKHFNENVCAVDRAVAVENKWRAQRYGVAASFATADGPRTVSEILDELLFVLADDCDALGCTDEAAHCRKIAERGTSADAQISLFERNRDEGATAALTKVAMWLSHATTSWPNSSPCEPALPPSQG